MRSQLPFQLAAWLLFAAACAKPAPYTWVQQLPPQPDPRTITTINPGDLVDVRVFGQENMSAKGTVRLDGTLTLPLLGQVAVAGQRPEDVAGQLKERLKPYVVAPEVTVVIEQSRVNVALIGEVKAVGVVDLDSPATVLQALAKAGGMTEFADPDSIYVLRTVGGGTTRRIRFTYKQLVDAQPAAIGFYLKTGDVVVVE
ncbi:MAG TPA: polysaccharide biosynthesis/export family protein [Polyangiales bacterium]|nr:polysaccharide biosynthesis/export family protein [Polyangiales bacterium]